MVILLYTPVFIRYIFVAMTSSIPSLLKKYEDIIKEEVNVKQLMPIDASLNIQKTFKPIGSPLSAKFGKDTGKIIQFGKQGNIKDIWEGNVIIFDQEGHERQLSSTDYEIVYEWLEGNDIAIDQDIIAKLDLELTPELKKEGIAREISRFLNQMRKDADYNVDAKVHLYFSTSQSDIKDLIESFADFFRQEALITTLDCVDAPVWDITAQFISNDIVVDFALKK